MEEESKKFTNYYLSTFIDYLLFSDADLNEAETINMINDDMFLNVFLNKLNKSKEKYSYPESVLGRMKTIIESLNNSVLLDEIKNQYNIISNNTSNDIYFDELSTKFMRLEYLNEDELLVDKDLIEKSIAFDYITIYTLIDDNMDIQKSPLYISSIKKFLYEYPEMFIDKKINKRAMEILKNQDDEEKDNLLYKIKHIDKFQTNNFSYMNFKYLYEYILIQNMLIDSVFMEKNADKIKDVTLNTLYNMIDLQIIGDERAKKNALEIMYTYKENNIYNMEDSEKKEFIDQYNDYLGKLNCLNSSDILINIENGVRLSGIKIFRPIINIDKYIRNDLKFLNYLIYDEELDIDSYELELTINKLLKMYPYMFENDEIYEKTMNCISKKQSRKIKNIYRR